MIASHPSPKPFAWAGIAFMIPRHWDTGQLGDGYALLESQSRPVLEFKTARIRGRFAFDRHMKRLAASGRRSAGLSIAWRDPPNDWPSFPAADIRTFRWLGERLGGRGLLHYCRASRRATVLQFYDPIGRDTAVIAPVLASFRDHATPSESRVAVYDIDATVPDDMTLVDFQFDAGRFKLVFGRSREMVTLWRFSPADVLLDRCGRDLAGIARDCALLPPAAPREFAGGNGAVGEWQWRPAGLGDRIRSRFRRRPDAPVHALRLWHRPEANRLLAVRADGLKNYETFDRICASYAVV